jgi:hypothetical protein
MLIGIAVGWAASAHGQAFQVVGGNQSAAKFRSARTTGGVTGSGEVIRAEVTHSQPRDSIAVVGISEPQVDWGIGGQFHGSWSGVTGVGRRAGVVGVSDLPAGTRTATYGVRGVGAAPDSDTYTAYGVWGEAECSDDGAFCTRYAVYANGDLVWTGSHYHVSDLRLKESVAPLSQALPKLLDLEVVSYEHIQSEELAHMHLPEGPQVGFVAQQVAEVLPDLVVEAVHPPAGDPLDRSPDAEPIRYQALKTIDLIPYLVRSIQEQQAEIEALKAELRPLQNRLARLESGPAAEESQIAAAF